MAKPRLLAKRIRKCWLLLFVLSLLAPLIIYKFQKQPPKPQFYIQAAPNNATNPATFATSVAYSPDGKTLACAFAIERRREVVRDQLRRQVKTQIRLYDAQTGDYHQQLQVVPGVVRNLEFSPDKNTLRGICENEFTRWWNVDTGKIARSIKHNDAYPVAFSSDERAARSADNQLLATGSSHIDPPWQSRFIFEYTSETDPNAHFGHASIWQIKTGKCVWDKQTGGKNVVSIALVPDNSQVAVAVSDTMVNTSSQRRGHVEVWKLPDGLVR